MPTHLSDQKENVRKITCSTKAHFQLIETENVCNHWKWGSFENGIMDKQDIHQLAFSKSWNQFIVYILVEFVDLYTGLSYSPCSLMIYLIKKKIKLVSTVAWNIFNYPILMKLWAHNDISNTLTIFRQQYLYIITQVAETYGTSGTSRRDTYEYTKISANNLKILSFLTQ